MTRILIIDDEDVFREDLASLLRIEGFDCETAPDGACGLVAAAEFEPEIILCDLVMPGLSGLDVVERLNKPDNDCAIVVVTAHATLDTAVTAFRLGAVDVVLKPIEPDALMRRLERIAEQHRLRTEVGSLRRALSRRSGGFSMIGESDAISEVRALIERVAPHDSPVLIIGESGTGKEVVAQAIHDARPNRSGPFVAVNCAAVVPSLFESELFGHAKGSFTGATAKREGFFETARGGTLLLDEVGEIPPEQQAKLLRAIERKEIIRVGESRPIPVAVRILGSTNRDLDALVEEGRFRADLFYRLRVVQLRLPPLRERREDIPALVEHFVNLFNDQMNLRCEGAEEDALQALCDFSWPGNVRELENAIERALIIGTQDRIHLEDLPPEICGAVDARSTNGAGETPDDLREALQTYERVHIRRVLQDANGNRSEAARRLGVDPSTLWRKLTSATE